MKTLQQIIEKQDELIQNFKDWCKIKSIHDEDTANDIAKEAVKIESELSVLKAQLKEQEVGNFKPINGGGWECPRCGRINAIWVSFCNCPPRSITSSTVNGTFET